MYYEYMPYLHKNNMMNIRLKKFENIELNEVGYLKVNVFRYVRRTPIANAFIRVSKLTISGSYNEDGSGVYIDTNVSDENGSVPAFELPVLKSENELYIVSVQADGYHVAYVIDVPIYPDITTTYDIYLRHYTFSGEPDYEFILKPQIPRHEIVPGIFN